MMKFRILSTSVLLVTLSGCTLNNDEAEDTGDAPGPWVSSGGTGVAAGGSTSSSSSATGTGGMPAGGIAGEGGESWDCEGTVAACYADAYACCGQGNDEQCEMLAGSCASIICPGPYPYPLACSDYIVPVSDGLDELYAFAIAVNTCDSLGLTATSAEILELGVFVTCCPDPNGGGMGTGGFGSGGAYATGGSGGYGGEEEVPDSYSMAFGSGGYATGGTGAGGYSTGGTGAGGSGPVIPGFCSGMAGAGGYATGGSGPMGGEAGEGGEGGFATGGMPAQ